MLLQRARHSLPLRSRASHSLSAHSFLPLRIRHASSSASPSTSVKPKLMVPATHQTFISQLQRCCCKLRKSHFSTSVPESALIIYVDGSHRPAGAGAAMYAKFGDRIIDAKLHLGPSGDYTSSTAEYWAALMALHYAYQLMIHGYKGRNFVVATDNLEVFACIASPASASHRDPAAAQIREQISRIRRRYPDTQLSSLHTRAHSGIMENESADRAAKAAAGGQTGVELLTH